MKEYQEELAAKLEAFLSSASTKVSELVALRAQLFPYDSLDAAATAFGQDLADSNKLNSEALISVRNHVSSLISTLDAIVAWITLSVPKIEDGGNFGVSIQFEIRKAITTARPYGQATDVAQVKAFVVQLDAQILAYNEAAQDPLDEQTK